MLAVTLLALGLLLAAYSSADVVGTSEEWLPNFPFPMPVEQISNPRARTAEWYKDFKEFSPIKKDASIALLDSISISSSLVGVEYTVSAMLPGPTLDSLYILRRRQDPINGQSEFSSGTYTGFYRGPIPVNCVLLIHVNTSNVIQAFGNDTFYYPNAMVRDPQGNFWFSDAGRHQVLSMNSTAYQLDKTIGVEFAPGKGTNRLCSPTDVAVTATHVYVADGHCNNRVVMYSKWGRYISEFGSAPTQSQVAAFGNYLPPRYIEKPRAITVHEQTDRLYITESGKSRVLIVKAGEVNETNFGTVIRWAENENLKPAGARLALHPSSPHVFVLNSYNTFSRLHYGFTFNTHNASLIGVWGPDPRGFVRPRAITVRAADSTIFVADAMEESEEKIWMFSIGDLRGHRNTRYIHNQRRKGDHSPAEGDGNTAHPNNIAQSSTISSRNTQESSHNHPYSSIYRLLPIRGTKGRGR